MKNKNIYASLNGRELLHMLGSGVIFSENLTGLDLNKNKEFILNRSYDSEIKLDSISVLVEISTTLLSHLNKDMCIEKDSYYNVPIIPIFYVNEIIFASEDDYMHMSNMSFNNLDLSIIDYSIDASLFPKISQPDLLDEKESMESSEKLFTLKVNNKLILDSLSGALRTLLTYAENEKFEEPEQNKKILEYIVAILNSKDTSHLLDGYLGQNLLSFLEEEKYLNSFTLDQIIFFSLVSNFSKTNNSERILNYELVLESLSFIPKNRINEEQKIELDTFTSYLKDLSTGKKSFKDEQLNEEQNTNFCQRALLILLRYNSIEKLQGYHQSSFRKVNPNFPIIAFFLQGLFLGYEALSNVSKGNKELQKSFSLIFLSMTVNSKLIKIKESESKISIEFASKRVSKEIDISNPHLNSVLSEFKGQGYDFKPSLDANVYSMERKLRDGTSFNAFLRMVDDNEDNKPVFRVYAELQEFKKVLSKDYLVSLLEFNFKSDSRIKIGIENKKILIGTEQLSGTLDSDEVNGIITDIINSIEELKNK
tara:strand:+ start:1127 stop:2737 length:1611 start_codon:yes stop_codon:yes gene_type:complete